MAVKRYDGTAWQVVAGKGDQGTSSSISTWVKTASGGETSLSGNDDNSQALSYTVGQELVFINGTLLKRGSDYTATNGTSITGLTALAANDVATVWTVNAFSVTGAIANTIVDAKGDLIVATGADTPGRLAVGSNNQVLTADSTTGTGLKWAAPSTTFVGAMAVPSALQSINNATLTAISLGGTDQFDTDSIHNPSSNNTRMTIPSGKGGYYLVTAACPMEDIGASGNSRLAITVNGSSNIKFSGFNGASDGVVGNTVSGIVNVSAGDYIEMWIYQNGGSTINTAYDGSNVHIFLTITKLGD